MKRGDADAAQHEQRDERAVAGRESDRADEHRGDQRTERDEPRTLHAIREESEQRLRERRGERGERDQRADQRETQMKLGDEQRQERREKARVGIDREVAERDENEPRGEHLSHGGREDSTLQDASGGMAIRAISPASRAIRARCIAATRNLRRKVDSPGSRASYFFSQG